VISRIDGVPIWRIINVNSAREDLEHALDAFLSKRRQAQI